MKRKILNIIILLLLLSGLAVFLYPSISTYISGREAKSYIAGFERISQSIQQPDQTKEDMHERLLSDMQEYNAAIYESGQPGLADPFSYEQPAFDLTQYGMDQNMVGYVTIPRMEIELPIFLGASTDNLAKGAANLGQTSLPVGGINTNTVLAAHRGYRGSAMFRDIESLEIGDKIYITNFWETLAYEVVETKVILPSDISEILIQQDRDLISLITCHPYTKNYQRYIVYAERTTIDNDEQTPTTGLGLNHLLKFNEMSSSQQLILVERWLPLAIILLLLVIAIVRFILKRFK